MGKLKVGQKWSGVMFGVRGNRAKRAKYRRGNNDERRDEGSMDKGRCKTKANKT